MFVCLQKNIEWTICMYMRVCIRAIVNATVVGSIPTRGIVILHEVKKESATLNNTNIKLSEI